ncbi:glycosyltransferase family 4 protein [Providencia sp. PROV032]|uniref:glycosyltransferase family 4 protein n=1 Tax=Providencia sp. PROV032 TaxID=2949764 RepID=UPI002349D4C8|nr:glycosyltransferase family 4 protein [Providencia sp. PROV032]
MTYKKTLCFSANTSWYLYNFRYSVLKSLKNDGYRIICIAPFDVYSQKLIDELNVEWEDLSINRKSLNPIREIKTILKLHSIYKKNSPDICINFTIKNNIYGTIAAKINNCSVINNITGLGTAFYKRNILYYIASLLYKKILNHSSFIFCQNKHDQLFIKQKFNICSEKIILTPGSGVNLKKFKKNHNKERSDSFNFLFVGRLIRDKGINELISAFELIDKKKYNCHLYIAGNIDKENRTAISIEQLDNWKKKSNITWLGAINDMPALYNMCDCIVLPSYSEGLPRTLIEAGAMGLPAIASDIPGCKDIISNGMNGYLCDARNTHDLYSKMLIILNSTTEHLNILSQNALLNVINNFNEDIVVEKTKFAINKIITFRD